MVGEVRAEQVDGVAGGVSEGGGQGCQEIPAGAAADGVDPGQSHEHCVWGAGEHMVGPAGHLWSTKKKRSGGSQVRNIMTGF